MEIVTEPDLRSAHEAQTFAKTVQTLLRYVGSSEADMEKGMMRFDASISTRPQGEEKLYPRAEIKNLNSFKSLEMAIAYEFKRQVELWEEGKPMSGDITVGWVEDKQKTVLLRDKEDAADYRYFPEPDLPPIRVTPEQIETLKAQVPETPLAKRRRFIEAYGLSEEEAMFFSEDKALADYFQTVAERSKDPAKAASFVGTILMAKLKEDNISIRECKVKAEHLAELIELIAKGTISNNTAKTTLLEAMVATGDAPSKIIAAKGLSQVSDSNTLEKMVDDVLAAHSNVVNDYKSGKQNALGFLVGQVMKASKGQGNPQMVNEILKKKLA
jgi:aspartyl-tRNA(Asn)/glutamyl-tRNA(Gln) amidotransferase subunit B